VKATSWERRANGSARVLTDAEVRRAGSIRLVVTGVVLAGLVFGGALAVMSVLSRSGASARAAERRLAVLAADPAAALSVPGAVRTYSQESTNSDLGVTVTRGFRLRPGVAMADASAAVDARLREMGWKRVVPTSGADTRYAKEIDGSDAEIRLLLHTPADPERYDFSLLLEDA
jgi:hypothetical protein